MRCLQEAADRFSDTSWQIHRQWQSDTKKAFPTIQNEMVKTKTTDDDLKPCTTNGHANGSVAKTATGNADDEVVKVEIESVNNGYETLPQKHRIDVILVRERPFVHVC